ncbi:MAG: accessory gene regulator B family protein [Lachnospiraceae bacterium]|nr:accessory gene regulator B family protein [Lachnospiraceae bacterium]
MEQVASAIVSKMLSADLISENETEQYNYGVQVLLEKLISYAILFGLAWLLHCLVEVGLFFVSFSIIRKYSGGIHCKRFESCLLISTVISFSGVALFPLVKNNLLLYQGGGCDVNSNRDYNWRYQQPQHRME